MNVVAATLGVVCWIAALLPPRLVRWIGHALGDFVWFVVRVRRRLAIVQIEVSLDCDRRRARRLGRRVYRHLGRGALEFLRLGRLTVDDARAMIGAPVIARLDALRASRGLLILSAHIGNWDLLACAAARAGLPVNVVTRRIKSSWVDRFWMVERRRCGVRLHDVEGSALAVRSALRRGEIVAMVLDQHQPGGVATTFFGRAAATSDALARFARATGAPVVPAFLLREGEGFRAVVDAPLAPPTAGSAGALAATQAYTAAIESCVRAHPEQWLWLHRRWKLADRTGHASPAKTVEQVRGRADLIK